jgi:ribosomal protein L7/L12
MDNLEPYQIWLLMAAAAYAGFLVGRATANRDGSSREERAFQTQMTAESVFSELNESTKADVDRLIQDGKIIHAVKVVREATGKGLKEAKQAVDWRRAMIKSSAL